MFRQLELLQRLRARFANVIISPVGAVINAGGPGFGTIADTFNHAGLLTGFTSGVTDFDSYLAGNPAHDYVFAGHEWFSNLGTSTASVTYDLGASTAIDRLALWNEDASGIGFLNLYHSIDGIAFSPLVSFAPINNLLNFNYFAQVVPFGTTTARYVRFDMSECPQPPDASFTACAVGEVAFRVGEPVPEPASLTLLGMGLAGLALRRRRR